MALQKTFTSLFGIDVEYWKIGRTYVDWHYKTCRTNLIGFVNQQARQDDKKELMVKAFDFNGENFTFNIEQKLCEQIYLKIKTLEDWLDAVDC